MGSTGFLPEDVYRYLLDSTVEEHPVLAKLRERTARLPQASMQIGPEQGAFLALLAKLIDARRILEVGVFTGYSALAMALAAPRAQLVALDIAPPWTRIATRFWEEAGVAGRIDLRLGIALQSMDSLPPGAFDLIFVDADKKAYPDYYEKGLDLLRSGGLLAIDNVLWGGRVVVPEDEETEAIVAVTRRAAGDDRVDCALVPIGDGVLLCRKKEAGE